MSDFYIKYIYGPAGQTKNYPNEGVIHFAEGQEKACERFVKCKSFLVYETGSKEDKIKGVKKIYAYGIPVPNQSCLLLKKPTFRQGKQFPYAAKIILKKRVNPKDGIPLDTIRKITGVKNIQRHGGLLKITEQQFEKLRECLDCIAK